MTDITSFLNKIKRWGSKEGDILAIGLVGSYARSKAKKDSDIDLMILCKNPEIYISDESWIKKFGNPKEIKNETWGQLKTKRVFFENGSEVEFNFDKKSWANSKNSGTQRVVNDGIQILVDKEGVLSNLQKDIKKPIQYLLVGYPYSGKTTLAKELEKKFGFARINIDELKFSRGYTDVGDDDVLDEVWNQIFKEADELIVKYLKEGKNLANEYAWITKEWRDRARKVAKESGFETKTIFIDVPEGEIIRRWKENQKTKQRFNWPESEFLRYLKDFEQLTEDEDFVVYDQSEGIVDWVSRNKLY